MWIRTPAGTELLGAQCYRTAQKATLSRDSVQPDNWTVTRGTANTPRPANFTLHAGPLLKQRLCGSSCS
ncbi:hypothetical protein PBY51_004606 [Eleginops maclovinus]|uniref:Uncharacterized protein n=1 Tax=Eleginops maclovinus TaxID=56733 RepID=A0AAN7Y0D7_ELEMC|nr:hypothetical protein PBY51_004606 [Eleginops maclovinus]